MCGLWGSFRDRVILNLSIKVIIPDIEITIVKMRLSWDCMFILTHLPQCHIYTRQWIWPALAQIMTCHLFGAEPLSEPMLGFYPRPVLAFGYCRCLCVCVCLSVNHQLVCAVTHQPFQLEPPNLDQRCKRPWLRSLLFFGKIDLEIQGQIELKCQNLPHFELVRAISHHQLKSVFPNFGQKCILTLLRSLLIWGWIDLDVLFYF